MPNKTNNLRWFKPKIKVGVVQDGDLAGNYIWGHGEPILQQMMERTDAEVEMHLRLRGTVVPKQFWVNVQELRLNDGYGDLSYVDDHAYATAAEPNRNWCVGCSPDNCPGCGAAPLAHTTPQHDRTAELEQLRQRIADSRHERDICHAECIKLTNEYNSQLAAKDEVIAEAGEMLAMRDRQLAALKTELREICSAIDDPACNLTLTAVECIKKLKAENESLRRDAERLDFILRKQLIVIQDCDDKYFTYNAQSGKRGPEMDSEAEAIDAAMAQGEQK